MLVVETIVCFLSIQTLIGARVAQWVRSLDLTTHTSLSLIRRGFAPSFVNYKKGCTWIAAASDKVYQLLAQGRWFSPGTPASSITKTGRHDIAEILMKVVLNTKNSNSIQIQTLIQLIFLWYSSNHLLSYQNLFFLK
jgi:hypothetical protein